MGEANGCRDQRGEKSEKGKQADNPKGLEGEPERVRGGGIVGDGAALLEDVEEFSGPGVGSE